MRKITLIIDNNNGFIDFNRKQVLKTWDYEASAYRVVNSFELAIAEDIFGTDEPSLWSISTEDELLNLVEAMDKVDESLLKVAAEKGLIITVQMQRNKTGRVETRAKKLDFDLIIAKDETPEERAENLLKPLKIDRELKEMLLDHVGQDWQDLVSLAGTIATIPKEQQERLTIDDLLARLPKAQGSVNDFALKEPLLRGDLKKVIELNRRAQANGTGHALKTLGMVLAPTFYPSFRVAALLKHNPRASDADIKAVLGGKGSPYYAKKEAQRLGFAKLEKIVPIVAELQAQMRGGLVEKDKKGDALSKRSASLQAPTSRADYNVLLEVALVQICNIIKG